MTPSSPAPFASIRDLVERCRLRNETAISSIVAHVRRREYAIVLGPRFSEKTFLLEDVASELRKLQMEPLLMNLEDLPQSTCSQFIGALIQAIAEDNSELSASRPLAKDERELQIFLQSIPATLKRNVALLIDHLEILPVNHIVVLLRVLRAILNETIAHNPPYFFSAVATSTFALADISLGPVSPFNLVPPVWVDDLGPEDSRRLVHRFTRELGIRTPDEFFDAIFGQTAGDRYAIARLCHRCAEIARAAGRGEALLADVAGATQWFLSNAETYRPFQEMRRSLEHDPLSLLALTTILERGVVPARELPISVARPEHLRLTGAVQTQTTDEGTVYRMRSELYRDYLSTYFHAARVSRVLFVGGWFDEAVDYLRHQAVLRRDQRIRRAYFDSITGSIFAARFVKDAVGSLASYIQAAFDVSAVTVYLVTADRGILKSVGQTGAEEDLSEIGLDHDSIERDAFVARHYVMDGELRRLAIPLCDSDTDPVGVVLVTGICAPRDEEFAELLGFIQRVSKALGRVVEHERRIEQLESLQAVTGELAKSVALQKVLEKTVEEGIKAIPGAQRGALLLYDDNDKRLHVREQRGYRESFVEEMIVEPEGDSYAAGVFRTGIPALIEDAQNDSRVTMRHDVDIAGQRSALCVQLSASGRRIGVFCIDNTTTPNVFKESAAGLLAVFAAQAAVAIQNAMVYRELYDLSLAINGSDLHAADIFHRVVRSIVRVTGAEAANMVLTRDVNDPRRAVAQPPDVYAYGMGDTFEQMLRPRPEGITAHVLKNRQYVIAPSDQCSLTLNRLAKAEGIETTIALPLLIQDEILGVLFVNFKTRHPFLSEEIDILRFYANECAVAIERVRQEEHRLHASVAWMGLDLSEMGHDITQAVSRLQANLYMIGRRVKEGSKLATLLDAAQQDANAIADVPRRALLPGSERVEVFDLRDLILRESQHWCAAHPQIALDLSAAKDVNAWVAADPGRVARVVKTLMQNAVRATKASKQPWIRVSIAIRGRRVEVTFTNNGRAIPPETAQRLFRDPVPSSGDGQGVGLLIARAIVFGYAGDLALTASDQFETAFTLSLPLAAHITEGETDA